jgi:hypothetical protein
MLRYIFLVASSISASSFGFLHVAFRGILGRWAIAKHRTEFAWAFKRGMQNLTLEVTMVFTAKPLAVILCWISVG